VHRGQGPAKRARKKDDDADGDEGAQVEKGMAGRVKICNTAPGEEVLSFCGLVPGSARSMKHQ
jgi:hypothetical protein